MQVWLLDYEHAHPEDVTGDLVSAARCPPSLCILSHVGSSRNGRVCSAWRQCRLLRSLTAAMALPPLPVVLALWRRRGCRRRLDQLRRVPGLGALQVRSARWKDNSN